MAIQKIEVDRDGNVDIYLRLLGDWGLDETVLIHHDETSRSSWRALSEFLSQTFDSKPYELKKLLLRK